MRGDDDGLGYFMYGAGLAAAAGVTEFGSQAVATPGFLLVLGVIGMIWGLVVGWFS